MIFLSNSYEAVISLKRSGGMKKILRSMRDGRKKEELGSAPSAALTLWMDEMEEAKKGEMRKGWGMESRSQWT